MADIAGVSIKTVYAWRAPAPPDTTYGTGGSIPNSHVPRIIAGAKERGIDLSWDDFKPPQVAS